ncbi:hypothetical protein DTO166G4_5939 [Paecilomyces variotii]|nr:hypothetical protein DTO166G4_5939 [Paecilomyces variotii]KAJ9231869.1 hypothetical protein DTO166G5_6572 [Paecilomyces variotii]KAJ9254241.1 hypothetical protein DTO195F2_6745 [Paecilomyces variotii]KAJ9292165.1 hypothetical protein DTO021C3_58 [Paecilomyces variotii]KAJ9327783.1 hypothetical protein DTO027B3_1491 [Paecilomyces variotii]
MSTGIIISVPASCRSISIVELREDSVTIPVISTTSPKVPADATSPSGEHSEHTDGRDGIEFLRAFGLRARPLSSTYSVGWQGWWNPKVIWKHSKCVGPLGTGQYYGLLLLPF